MDVYATRRGGREVVEANASASAFLVGLQADVLVEMNVTPLEVI